MIKSILSLIVLLIGSNAFASELTPSEVVVDYYDAEKEYDMERFVYHFSEGTVNEFVHFFESLYQMREIEEFEQLTGMQIEEFLKHTDIEKLVIIFEGIAESTEEFEVNDIEILSESIDGDNSTVIILREDEEEEIRLVLENDEWKIDMQTIN